MSRYVGVLMKFEWWSLGVGWVCWDGVGVY